MQEISPEVTDVVKEEGGGILKLCYQCGTCTGICPWNRVGSFLVRRLIHKGQLGIVDFEDEVFYTILEGTEVSTKNKRKHLITSGPQKITIFTDNKILMFFRGLDMTATSSL